jgi:hypothetical protein
MISAATLSLLALYPWNLGVSGYYTIGEYSIDRTYRSEQAIVSLDRRGKDALILGYEHLAIKDDFGTYKQDNILFRNVLWLQSKFRLGSIAGLVLSNSVDEGLLLGGQLEGDLPWLGYSLDYTYLEFQGWELQSPFWVTIEHPIVQGGVGISKKISRLIVRAHIVGQRTGGNGYLLSSAKIVCDVGKDLFITVHGSIGESRYAIEPYLLVVDNNPDILKLSFGVHTFYRVTPNVSISGEALRKEYSPAFDLQWNTTYHVKYLVFGIQLRL